MKTIFLFALTWLSFHVAVAQKIEWESGDASVLNGSTAVSTMIIFNNLMVSDLAESQFVQERQNKFNEEKPGEGDKFVEDWNLAKSTKWNKRFAEHLSKASKEKVKSTPNNEAADYIVIITPNNIDLGKGRYIGTKPALVDFDIAIVAASSPEIILAKGKALQVKGESKAPKGTRWIPGGAGTAIDIANRVQNFDLTNRIAESFELLAVALGKSLR